MNMEAIRPLGPWLEIHTLLPLHCSLQVTGTPICKRRGNRLYFLMKRVIQNWYPFLKRDKSRDFPGVWGQAI
jgi:hypothetical protein